MKHYKLNQGYDQEGLQESRLVVQSSLWQVERVLKYKVASVLAVLLIQSVDAIKLTTYSDHGPADA